MKMVERVISIAFFVTIVLKFFSAPGGGLFFVLMSLLLSSFYVLFSYPLLMGLSVLNFIRMIWHLKICFLHAILSIGFGLGLSLLIMAVMFIIQNWHGSMLMFLVGVFILLIVFALGLIGNFVFSEKKVFFSNILFRVVFWLIFGGISLLFNTMFMC